MNCTERGLTRVAAAALALLPMLAGAQTPEEAKAWEAQRAQAQAEARVQADRVAQARAARRADPMAWVRTLDTLPTGGWEFRAVAPDGSWALYGTEHQMKRSGRDITIWLRQEYPETQHSPGGDPYLSFVEKVQYNCGNDRFKPLLVIYYSANSLSGSQQSDESDPKHTPWTPVVPGTQSETMYHWACDRPL